MACRRCKWHTPMLHVPQVIPMQSYNSTDACTPADSPTTTPDRSCDVLHPVAVPAGRVDGMGSLVPFGHMQPPPAAAAAGGAYAPMALGHMGQQLLATPQRPLPAAQQQLVPGGMQQPQLPYAAAGAGHGGGHPSAGVVRDAGLHCGMFGQGDRSRGLAAGAGQDAGELRPVMLQQAGASVLLRPGICCIFCPLCSCLGAVQQLCNCARMC
jgi:hypothetical protein